MSNYTEHYNLKKPLKTESYDVDVANTNNDIIDEKLYSKVDKVAGKGLSSNDFTNEYKKKIDSLQTLYRFKGSVETFEELQQKQDNTSLGDVWNCKEDNKNYAWNNNEWVELGTTINTENLVKKDEVYNKSEIEEKETLVKEELKKATENKRLKIEGKSEQATRSGKNLFNKSKTTDDKIINSNGTIENVTNKFYSDYIYIKGKTDYVFNTSNNVEVALYNESTKEFITRLSTKKINTDVDCYVRFNGNIEEKDYIMLEKGSISTDYELYGASPSLDYPSRIINIGDNINLLNVKNALKGYYFYETGELTEGDNNWFYLLIKVKSNESYTFSGVTTTQNSIGIAQFNSNKEFVKSGIPYKNTTFTTGSTTAYLGISIRKSEINEVKLEEGSIATLCTPYNCGSIDYKIENKNLFDKNNAIIIDTGISSSGLGLQNNELRTLIFPCKPNKTYTISKILSSRFSLADLISYSYGNTTSQSIINNNNATNLTITTSTNANYIAVYYYNASTDTLTEQEILDSIQIEEGAIATDYVEHQEQTIHFPLSKGQLLHEEDYIDSDGIHQNRKTIVLNGTEDWNNLIAWGNYYRVYITLLDAKKFNTNVQNNQLCSHFIYNFNGTFAINNDTKEGIFAQYMNTQQFYFVTTKTTTESWKSYLAEQYANCTPVTIEYELAEEIVTPLTKEQKDAYYELQKAKYVDKMTLTCLNEIETELVDIDKSLEESFLEIEKSIIEIKEQQEYSTEEKVIGTYAGKPLYKKTLSLNTPATTNNTEVVNFDSTFIVRNYYGFINVAASNQLLPINFYFTSEYNIATYVTNSKEAQGKINMRVGSNAYLNQSATITIEYTKTTD